MTRHRRLEPTVPAATASPRPPFREKAELYAAVIAGSVIGSVLRALVSLALPAAPGAFPWATLFVNVTGSFAIGLLAALVSADGRPVLGSDARAFLIIGVLGGFTTFSSFSLETLTLARSGALGAAGANVALSFALCLGGVWLGLTAAALFNR